MQGYLRAALLSLALLCAAPWFAAPAQAQCVQGLLANCPPAQGLSLNDKLWADQASLAPHSSRAATISQVLALAPQVYPMLSSITVSGLCSGSGTNAINLTSCALPGSAITTGTIAAARLPLPTSGAGGAVQAFSAPSGQFLTGITVNGTVTAASITSASIGDAAPMTGLDVSYAVGTGASPTVSACGSGAAASGSTDFSGAVAGMTGSTCTLTFAATHNPKLNCVISPAAAVAYSANSTTTALTVTGALTGFAWSCL